MMVQRSKSSARPVLLSDVVVILRTVKVKIVNTGIATLTSPWAEGVTLRPFIQCCNGHLSTTEGWDGNLKTIQYRDTPLKLLKPKTIF